MKKMPCEVFRRVCGYFAPGERANPGKQAEFANRKEFDETTSLTTGRNMTGKKTTDIKPPDYDGKIIIYGLPMCSGCQEIKAKIIKAEIPFEYRDAKERKEELAKLGFRNAVLPLVYSGRWDEGATFEELTKGR